ncbi:unnamed protein product [Rotaria sp. Silwood1]|nr:unnamed protein product [Rotaria sp. Silwood1]
MFLDLSRHLGESSTWAYEASYGRGYVFRLKNPLKIRSVQLEASVHGQVFIYVVNNSGIIVNKASLISNDITMKWTTIPIIAELNTDYSILVWSPNINGRFSYKKDDNNFRTIDSECSIENRQPIMSSSNTYQLDCGGRACPICGKCRDWYWDKGSRYLYFCTIKSTSTGEHNLGFQEAGWQRRHTGCYYGPGAVYHDVLHNGCYHSLCVCEKRRKN